MGCVGTSEAPLALSVLMETVDLKLVLLGQPGVGKTCLVYRYLYNTFGETISTIGASFAMKKVDAGGVSCNLGIWDTAGQERFDSLSSFYCRGARAAIICFDLTDRQTFNCLQNKWIKKVTQEAEPDCHICIVATKHDLVLQRESARAVKMEEVQALAQKYKADVFETSAKTGNGVIEIFEKIVQHFSETRHQWEDGNVGPNVHVTSQKKSGGCCGN